MTPDSLIDSLLKSDGRIAKKIAVWMCKRQLQDPTEEIILTPEKTFKREVIGTFYFRTEDVLKSHCDYLAGFSPGFKETRGAVFAAWLLAGSTTALPSRECHKSYSRYLTSDIVKLAANGRTKCFCPRCGSFAEKIISSQRTEEHGWSGHLDALSGAKIRCEKGHLLYTYEEKVSFRIET